MYQKLEDILTKTSATKIVLSDGEHSYTGLELWQKAAAVAQFFLTQGVRVHDRVAVQLENCVEFVICYFAGILAGITIVPININLPQSDIDYILSVAKPVLLIKNKMQLADLPDASHCQIASTSDTLIAIFFTSGTTSRPKGVCHRTITMLENADAFNELTGLNSDTKMLHVLPMGYMAGFLNTILCPILSGGSVVLAPQLNAQQAINFWSFAIKQQINTIWLTPTMAAMLARVNRDPMVPRWTAKNLRHVFVGTAPLPLTTQKMFAETFGVACLESYGMTEVMLAASNTSALPRKTASVGRLLAHVCMQARDNNGNVLPTGQAGSLYIQSRFALQGYLNLPTQMFDHPLEDGWFATGDYGYVDEENNLFITGRIKDLIIRGGTNISPRAVEEALLLHDDIVEVAVVGQPHDFWGEEVVAFLLLQKNRIFNQSDVVHHCKRYLHPDAVPTIFKIVQDFPRASTGKIQTQQLRALLSIKELT